MGLWGDAYKNKSGGNCKKGASNQYWILYHHYFSRMTENTEIDFQQIMLLEKQMN